MLPPQGYFGVRFVADNPGVWFFHCHIDWNLSEGLAMVMIEAPLQIQERMSVPEDHWAACRVSGVEYEGNAAENTEDLLDPKGQNKQIAWLPAGFTEKGIVASVFSCVSAFLGMAFITVSGLSGLQTAQSTQEGTSDDTTPPRDNPQGVLSEETTS